MSKEYPRLDVSFTTYPHRAGENFFRPPPPVLTHFPTISPIHSPIHSPTHSSTYPPTLAGSSNPRPRKRLLQIEDIEGLEQLVNKKVRECNNRENIEIARLNEIVDKQQGEIVELLEKLRIVEGNLELLKNSIEDALYTCS